MVGPDGAQVVVAARAVHALMRRAIGMPHLLRIHMYNIIDIIIYLIRTYTMYVHATFIKYICVSIL